MPDIGISLLYFPGYPLEARTTKTAKPELNAVCSALVCAVCQWVDLLLPRWFWLATLSGFAGMLLDSILGATIERPGRLGNNSVNFISGAFSAFVAILIAFLFR